MTSSPECSSAGTKPFATKPSNIVQTWAWISFHRRMNGVLWCLLQTYTERSGMAWNHIMFAYFAAHTMRMCRQIPYAINEQYISVWICAYDVHMLLFLPEGNVPSFDDTPAFNASTQIIKMRYSTLPMNNEMKKWKEIKSKGMSG